MNLTFWSLDKKNLDTNRFISMQYHKYKLCLHIFTHLYISIFLLLKWRKKSDKGILFCCYWQFKTKILREVKQFCHSNTLRPFCGQNTQKYVCHCNDLPLSGGCLFRSSCRISSNVTFSSLKRPPCITWNKN